MNNKKKSIQSTPDLKFILATTKNFGSKMIFEKKYFEKTIFFGKTI